MEHSEWLKDAKSGDFDSIPSPLTWDGGGRRLAIQINCYKLSSGTELSEEFYAAERQYHRSGTWTGDALRLWKLLFFAARRDHFTSGFGGDDDEGYIKAMDALSEKLRVALMGSGPEEKQKLLKLMNAGSSA